MKSTIFTMLFAVLLLVGACGSQKVVYTPSEKAKFEEMVDAASFRLIAEWANPLATRSVSALATAGFLPPGSSPNRINIMASTAFLYVTKDSVHAQLPYYGERQVGNTYNQANVGIQFKGAPKDFKLEYQEKKESYYFAFYIINDQGEGFNVNGTLFPNLRTTFYINSTQRLTIGYTGRVVDTKTEELQP